MAGFDAFLEIEGIKGETEDQQLKEHVELLSYSFGASQAGNFAYGGGGGTGKVQFQDFHFTKRCDKGSPTIFQHCCNGKHIPKATMKVRKSGGAESAEQQIFFQVTFTDCLVSNQSISGVGQGDPIPTESISFNFTQMKMEYFTQDNKGIVKLAGAHGWDLKKNTKV